MTMVNIDINGQLVLCRVESMEITTTINMIDVLVESSRDDDLMRKVVDNKEVCYLHLTDWY